MTNGTCVPNPTVAAEIAGPNTNPNPNEAPMIPNPFALSFISVVSEITAEATGIFPAVIPSSARAINRNSAVGAKAAIKNDSAVPPRDKTSNGLRPYLSESLPIKGVERKEHTEKSANKRPFWKSVRPNFCEYEYKIGIIIPYPKTLTTAISAIISKFLFDLKALSMTINYRLMQAKMSRYVKQKGYIIKS